MRLDLDCDGRHIAADLVHRTEDLLLRIDGAEHRVIGVRQTMDGSYQAIVDGRVTVLEAARDGDTCFIKLADRVLTVTVTVPEPEGDSGGAAAGQVMADMPGTVIEVAVAVGDAVAEGDTLMVIESMKLQTTIAAPRAGTVADLPLGVGATFNRGDELVRLDAEEEQ